MIGWPRLSVCGLLFSALCSGLSVLGALSWALCIWFSGLDFPVLAPWPWLSGSGLVVSASWPWSSDSDFSGLGSRVSALSGPSCRIVALWSRSPDLAFPILTFWYGSSDLWLVSGLGSLRIGEIVSVK